MSEERVWVNFVLTGEPARIIREAKTRGIEVHQRRRCPGATMYDGNLERELRGSSAPRRGRAARAGKLGWWTEGFEPPTSTMPRRRSYARECFRVSWND